MAKIMRISSLAIITICIIALIGYTAMEWDYIAREDHEPLIFIVGILGTLILNFDYIVKES